MLVSVIQGRESMHEFTYIHLINAFLLVLCFLYFMAQRKNLKGLNKATERLKSIDQRLENTSVEELISLINTQIQITETKIEDGSKHLSKLFSSIEITDSKLALINSGLLPPMFSIDDDEEFKAKIREHRNEQFLLIKSKKATYSATTWSWMGSKHDGQRMVDAYNYILLHAFNSEYDSIVRKMRVSTINSAQNKLKKLDEQLSKLGETVNCSISDIYFNAKMDELNVWASELKSKESKKLERKRHQKILREQSKLAKVDDDIEDEIDYRRSDLEKAKKIALKKVGLDKASALLEIESLQQEIKSLEQKFERSVSQAQMTKAGYIYVISNLGSFGENVVKIGMTRRLEPLDRVNELGDASVPFKFDVHTLAFVEDAPSLEKQLHNIFNDKRVNKENFRKEFFIVPPEEVKQEMEALGIDSDWYFDVEAKEYRETELILAAKKKVKQQASNKNELPEEI